MVEVKVTIRTTLASYRALGFFSLVHTYVYLEVHGQL